MRDFRIYHIIPVALLGLQADKVQKLQLILNICPTQKLIQKVNLNPKEKKRIGLVYFQELWDQLNILKLLKLMAQRQLLFRAK